MVESAFPQEFEGCTLNKLSYPGDARAETCQRWAAQYQAGKAIVICADFDVGTAPRADSLAPGTACEGWEWVLVQNADGTWTPVANGAADTLRPCGVPGCTITGEHSHGTCGVPGCTIAGEHSHGPCGVPGCTIAGEHSHTHHAEAHHGAHPGAHH